MGYHINEVIGPPSSPASCRGKHTTGRIDASTPVRNTRRRGPDPTGPRTDVSRGQCLRSLRSLDTVRARAFEWPALCAVRRVLPRGRLDGAASVGRGWLLPQRLYARTSWVRLLPLSRGLCRRSLRSLRQYRRSCRFRYMDARVKAPPATLALSAACVHARASRESRRHRVPASAPVLAVQRTVPGVVPKVLAPDVHRLGPVKSFSLQHAL